MNLLKTSLLNGVAVLIKMVTLFTLNKILALYVGPNGYAAIGQFQNFIQMVSTFSGSAINTAIVKYTSEYHEDESAQRRVWITAGTIIFFMSMFFSVLIILCRNSISEYIFHTDEYSKVFFIFAIFLVLFNFNTMMLAILNGKKEILKLTIANIAGSSAALIITSIFVMQYGLYGALIGISIYQSLSFFVTFYLCYKADWFKISNFLGKIDLKIGKKFSFFALMAFVSVFFGNISQIYIRKFITFKFDINYAGYWDAISRLSLGYLMFASTILSVYYLPKLSEMIQYSLIKQEVFRGYLFILPIAILCSLFIFLNQDLIISLLFSKEFFPMKELLLWQLIGDIIKIGSWLISYMMLSKAMTKIFIFTESFFALSIIPITMIFVEYFGFKGVTIAFALNGLLYWIVCSYFAFRKLKGI